MLKVVRLKILKEERIINVNPLAINLSNQIKSTLRTSQLIINYTPKETRTSVRVVLPNWNLVGLTTNLEMLEDKVCKDHYKTMVTRRNSKKLFLDNFFEKNLKKLL